MGEGIVQIWKNGLNVMNQWVEKHVVQTYIRLDDQFSGCEFNMNWDEYIWSSEKK